MAGSQKPSEPAPSGLSRVPQTVVRLGVVGAGRIGRVHAANLAGRIPDAELAGIADVRPEAAAALARECGTRAAADYRELLDDRSIHAIVVCSSTDTHARLIEESAAAGKHVFCEKPLDLDAARIRACLSKVERAGVRLQLGFNRRFDPQFQRVAALVREGGIGTPHLVRITSRDPEPPPPAYVAVSGGIFLDMTIHDFDMARFLVNDEIEEVHAAGAVLVDRAIGEAGDWDTAVVTLRYRGGAIGVIDNSRKAVYGYDQRVEVFGSKGCALAPNVAPNDVAHWTADGRRQDPPHHFFIERYRDAYVAEMREFVRCVREDRAPSVGGNDGLQALLIGLAAHRSSREGRPVKLHEIECPTPR